MARLRLDQLLLDRGLVESKSRAQSLIMAGLVFSNEKRLDKAGIMLNDDCLIELRGQDHPWVSRGGLKLEKALSYFSIDAKKVIALDIGASTGGFTDVLLSKGAQKIYAIDVGRGQLAWRLRQDPRVVVLEKTNARYLTSTLIPDPIEAIVCDASFIGLEIILPTPLSLTHSKAWLVALIKPQFEVGRENVGKGGIVRDPELHQSVCTRIENWLNQQQGWRTIGICESPISGADGNKEFLLYGQKL
jgi:23S rRNA (cytidine1920-2'-O)/16S rRNA (cytidine1409-2'-O)-methyltransferase